MNKQTLVIITGIFFILLSIWSFPYMFTHVSHIYQFPVILTAIIMIIAGVIITAYGCFEKFDKN